MLVIADLARGNMPFAMWGLQKKVIDATAVRGIEANDVMKVLTYVYP